MSASCTMVQFGGQTQEPFLTLGAWGHIYALPLNVLGTCHSHKVTAFGQATILLYREPSF